MAQPYIGEIRLFAGNFAPAGWAFCDGSLLAISENETLFNLIGTTYGGDGQSTFALPDLRGRVPIHQGTGGGSSYILAETGGAETVTLTANQIPAHSHTVRPTARCGKGATSTPTGAVWAKEVNEKLYGPKDGTQMDPNAAVVQPAGGNQEHDNMQPYLGLNFIISLFGVFPSQ